MSGGQDDVINAFRGGDDIIDAGAGDDFVRAGAGNDVIIGGTGSNILIGEAGDDRIYADSKLSIDTAIQNGNTQAGSGDKGSWLTGKEGDDTLVGAAGNDVLTGGLNLYRTASNDNNWRQSA